MKCSNFIVLSFIWSITFISNTGYAQGQIENNNGTTIIAVLGLAPTRIGSIDGPLAGTNILAQLLAGVESDSLQPVGDPMPHLLDVNGTLTGVVRLRIEIPFIPEGSSGGFAQAAVWDRAVWGENFSDVPENQLGYTEIGEFPRVLPGSVVPLPMVTFQQTAIVPAIPEPETWALLLAAGTILIMRRRRSAA